MRRPEFRALKVVRGRYRSPHARGAPFGWARTASNTYLLGAWPTPADQGGPSGDSAGLTGLSETKRVRHRRPARTELAPSRAVPHRRDNAPRRTPVSTRITGTGPFTLRLAKRCGLKRVVCYPCYAFKVCVGLAEWGRGRARTRLCLPAHDEVAGGGIVYVGSWRSGGHGALGVALVVATDPDGHGYAAAVLHS